MNKVRFLLALILFANILFSKQISHEVALKAANNWLNMKDDTKELKIVDTKRYSNEEYNTYYHMSLSNGGF